MIDKRLCGVAVLCIGLALGGCGGSSGGGGGGAGGGGAGGGGGGGGGGGAAPEPVTVLLGTSIKNALIQPNTPTQITFTYTMPNDLFLEPVTAYSGVTLKFAESMAAVQLTSAPVAMNGKPSLLDPVYLAQKILMSGIFGKLIGIESALAAETASVTAFVSYPGDPEVCTTGARIGPYTFTGDIDSPWTADTESVTATDAEARAYVIAQGSFEVCMVISELPLPMDAYLTFDAFQVDAMPCDEAPPEDSAVLGSWSGTYSCDNVGYPSEENLDITLTISKNEDGSYSYIDDGGASYTGHFCGSKFRFRGGLEGDYTESGEFMLTGAGVATKKSTWDSSPSGFSWGTCFDNLNKD